MSKRSSGACKSQCGGASGPKERSRNNAASKIDNAFVESAVRSEATQQLQQALFGWQAGSHMIVANESETKVQLEEGDILDAICRQYGHTMQSQASPLERWATLSTSNAEFPLHAKLCLEGLGVSLGSLESIETRAYAARAITCGLKNESKVR